MRLHVAGIQETKRVITLPLETSLNLKFYANPDLLGIERSVYYLTPLSSYILLMFVAVVVTWALFGFLNAINM